MKRAWRTYWRDKARDLRIGWAEFVDAWEADTEPGYPMTALMESRRALGLALADLYDAIGGRA